MMLRFLLIGAALFQQPSVEDLLRALNDDVIATREGAAKRLVERGEEARDPIREELKKNPPAEVRARLEDVLRRLDAEKRRKEFKGGNVVNGLSGRLTAEKDKETAAVVLTVEIMNVDHELRDLVPIREWNTHMPGSGVSLTSSHADVQVKLLSGEPPLNQGDLLG